MLIIDKKISLYELAWFEGGDQRTIHRTETEVNFTGYALYDEELSNYVVQVDKIWLLVTIQENKPYSIKYVGLGLFFCFGIFFSLLIIVKMNRQKYIGLNLKS